MTSSLTECNAFDHVAPFRSIARGVNSTNLKRRLPDTIGLIQGLKNKLFASVDALANGAKAREIRGFWALGSLQFSIRRRFIEVWAIAPIQKQKSRLKPGGFFYNIGFQDNRKTIEGSQTFVRSTSHCRGCSPLIVVSQEFA